MRSQFVNLGAFRLPRLWSYSVGGCHLCCGPAWHVLDCWRLLDTLIPRWSCFFGSHLQFLTKTYPSQRLRVSTKKKGEQERNGGRERERERAREREREGREGVRRIEHHFHIQAIMSGRRVTRQQCVHQQSAWRCRRNAFSVSGHKTPACILKSFQSGHACQNEGLRQSM